jgi:hypothetical protein
MLAPLFPSCIFQETTAWRNHMRPEKPLSRIGRAMPAPVRHSSPGRASSGVPRIEQRNAERLEVRDIASDDRQTVDQRGRGDQGIAFRAWIGNVKMRAAPRHGGIDCEYAALEARQNLVVYPGAENGALPRVPARSPERAQLDFEDGNRRKKEMFNRSLAGPSDDVAVRSLRPCPLGA